MKPTPSETATNELVRQREDLRRNFIRANAAVAVILLALLALAVAAVVAGIRAGHNQELAEAASLDRQRQLADALREQASALRFSGQAGRRFAAMLAVSNAAALGPSPELRTEAIACLALDDLTPARVWPEARDATSAVCDNQLNRFAFGNDGHHLKIFSTTSDAPPLQIDLAAATGNTNVNYMGLSFSPRGDYLATRLDNGGFLAWTTDSGRIAFACMTNEVYGMRGTPAFTADERWMFFVEAEHGTNLMRANFQSGKIEALPIPITPWFSLFRVESAGQRVAVANRSRVEIWNLESHTLERTLETTTPVAALAWSRSGRKLAAGCFNGDVVVWDLQKANLRQLIGHTAGIQALVFSGNGERLCSASGDGSSRLWEVSSGRALLNLEGQVLQMDQEGTRLAVVQPGQGLGLWQLVPPVGTRILHAGTGVRGEGWKADLSPDGRWLAWAAPDALQVWDLDSVRPPIMVPYKNLYSVFWHPGEATLFLVTDGRIETRMVAAAPANTDVGVVLSPPTVLDLPTNLVPVMAAMSGNARTLAAVDGEGGLWMGDLEAPKTFVRATALANPSGPFGSGSLTGSGRLAVSPDGKWVATVDMLKTAAPHIFDARTGKLEKVLPTATGTVGFSPDGHWLATGGKSEMTLWTVGTWSECWRRPRTGLPIVESGIAFSHDSSVLAVTESPQLTALLDRATGRLLAEFTPPDLSANAGVRLSAAGNRIVVPTLNSAVMVWDLEPIRKELTALGLDWDQPAAVAKLQPRPAGVANSTGAILFGLACVTPAAFFALWSLRRHRRLLQQFVESEAEAQRRHHELEAAKEELMHSRKMKALGTLAAGIAHDFNNLLSVIRMANKLIGRATKDNQDVTEEVTSIEKAVQRGKQVVSSMLGYSRGRASDNGACDLNEVVEETVALLSREFLSGLQLTLALDRNAPPVRVGRSRLEQILLNLCVNAAEAMKGQGKLEITVRCERTSKRDFVLRPRASCALVELRVADSGPGIAPEILPRVFEPFFTTKSVGAKQGTGLGLSMVYSIAEHDGLGIAVESPPDGGALFQIFLPAGEPEKLDQPLCTKSTLPDSETRPYNGIK